MKRIFTLTLFVIFALQNFAQETFPVNGTADPRHTVYAFKNAIIHTDYKTSVQAATLLIQDGKILSSGAGVTIPANAVVFDLKGKHIYPSLIDIFSDYGMADVKKPENDHNPQFISKTKGAYNWNQAVKAEYDAYRNFTADGKKAEELRKMGFGTVMSLSRDGIVRGSSTVVMLGDERENEMIIRDRAASNFSFNKGSSTQDYPSSLLGSIALLRQTYYDADWYTKGGYKEEYNISLDAFNKNKNLPQIFEAGDKQNVLRAVKIGSEFGVNYIIKSDGDEFERIEEIKNAGAALIVPLTFPDGYDFSDPYEAVNVSLHQMKYWELAPTNPGVLASKNISFALTAADLKNKTDFWKNLRKAIENGLTEEDALKALTFTPAALLKLDDKIGALKNNMLANFIITSTNISNKDNQIFENWVNGKRYQIADPILGDVRGNYSLTIDNLKPMRIKIGGEINSPEAFLFEDTTSAKISFLRQGSILTFQMELKKSEPKGNYRLTGDASTQNWNGNVLLPTAEWGKWSMKLDSAFIPPVPKADSIKKESPKGVVYFPNMAYGWKELPKAKTYLITNATVWTNEKDGILKNTDVLIENGKIKQIGKNLVAPAGCEVTDGTNLHVTPGIIDEHSHIAVSHSVNEGTQSSSAEVRIGDVVDADDVQIYRQLAGGVTTSHLLHGSANAIGGQTQLIKLRWGQPAEKLKFEGAPGFIKFALGENVKQSNWGDNQVTRFPQTRMGVEQVYWDYFTRASIYNAKRSLVTVSADQQSIPVRRDLDLDALVEIMKGKRFITCHSYVQSEINMLMHVADSFGFKVNTFTHILEGYKVADKMKAHGVSGASTFSDWWAYKFEVYEAIPYNGAIMHKVGLNVSYNSDDAEMARRLNQEAAKAVMYGGVSEEEAFKFVTLNPAKMLHIDERTGSLKVGKDGDVVVWNDNPLSIYAKPLQTYVDGIKYFDIKQDEILRKEITAEKARLMQKMADAKNKGESTQKPVFKALELKHCNDSELFMPH